jgi:hypothetical protein
MFSGMGVPDLYGTIGRFSFYTSTPLTEKDKDSRGKIVYVDPSDNEIDTYIYGPKVSVSGSVSESKIPLRIVIDSVNRKASLRFQGNTVLLEEGHWSDFQRVSFKTGIFRKTDGIAKFYLRSVGPEFSLYLSAINFDPRNPPFPMTHPRAYSAKIAKRIGLYYTQGMPHDAHVWALTEGRITERNFLEQADAILSDKEKILKQELKEFKGGVFFFYFDTLDMIQHVFWRYLDTKSHLYKKASIYTNTIFKYYEKIDRIIGEVLDNMDSGTDLIVLSDHGFTSFRRAVHLNRWLMDNGYLFLKKDREECGEFFQGVDWSQTKAYALGFGGIYLNRIGRDYYGIVDGFEVQAIKKEIAAKLNELCDPQGGEKIVSHVYTSEEAFEGPYVNDAPDLFVGFNAGYRASWQTALGGAPDSLIEDNTKEWSGDHMVDPVLVKGVIFTNKKADLNGASILDICPTILRAFGITKVDGIKGRDLFSGDDDK